jgi:hypothetical protein
MTIANELSADVATAILLNGKGNRTDLLKIIEKVHLELSRLSFEDHPVSLQTREENVSKRIPTDSRRVVGEEFGCVIAPKSNLKITH